MRLLSPAIDWIHTSSLASLILWPLLSGYRHGVLIAGGCRCVGATAWLMLHDQIFQPGKVVSAAELPGLLDRLPGRLQIPSQIMQ